MQFKEYPYERILQEEAMHTYEEIKNTMKEAKDFASFKRAFEAYQEYERKVDTMYSLSYTRFNLNTQDPFYKEENAYWDEAIPHFQNMTHQIDAVLLASPYVEELKKEVPSTYFQLLQNAQEIFDEKIIPYLQEENKLGSEYDTLLAEVILPFDGKDYTLTNFAPMLSHKNRNTRRRAWQVYCQFMEDKEEELDRIYGELVRVRDTMAKTLGYENFIPLGYKRMNRLDYTQEDVARYREEIQKEVVPFVQELYAKQKQRLGVDTLHFYDEAISFKSGNPTPKHDAKKMVELAGQMYHELSPESDAFFAFMQEHALMDLESKVNKTGGGYCTYFPLYRSPFIFANFNGTSGDVDVLTHEAGHALQAYASRDITPLACMSPTLESCEIHSMSMEFFAWPWMPLFFEEDTNKYYYDHLAGTFRFLPYGVLVDHFQHVVYAHPQASAKQRKQMWRDLEKIYLPQKNYEGYPILEKGCWWYKQSHIFQNPFYYIDYALAQVCALQFWLRMQNKDPQAFADYYAICEVGGTLPFTKICEKANIISPFTKGCLHEVVEKGKAYLNTIDDTKL